LRMAERGAKGIVFAADSLAAVAMLAFFITGLAFLSAKTHEDSGAQLLLKKQADDMLAALERTGELPSMNLTALNLSIAATLPDEDSYEIALDYYNYSSGGFAFSHAASAARGNANRSKSVAASQREFVVMANGTVMHYGIATLRVWVG